jgi:hypothetical protein
MITLMRTRLRLLARQSRLAAARLRDLEQETAADWMREPLIVEKKEIRPRFTSSSRRPGRRVSPG